MRYQCRLPDKPARNDVLYPGTYNARRDGLEGYWRVRSDCAMAWWWYRRSTSTCPATPSPAAPSVPTKGTGRGARIPSRSARDLLLACLWAEWEGPEGRLLSFATITDAPPSDVAAAGHDRGVVPIRKEHLDAWLNPEPDDLARQYRILDDREEIRYVYEEAG